MISKIAQGNSNMWTNGELNALKILIEPGDIVFDVGANVGDWSNNVFNNINSVSLYSFEPIKSVFEKLKTNLSGRKANVFNIALSDFVGSKEFCFYQKDSTLSGFYDRDILREKLNLIPEKILVEVETLDHFCDKNNISHIDFLKIDTEGNEFNVLLGAKNMLAQKRISMAQFEYGGTYNDAKITLKQVFDFLSSFGYSVFKITPVGLMLIKEWNNELENFEYANYLALDVKK